MRWALTLIVIDDNVATNNSFSGAQNQENEKY